MMHMATIEFVVIIVLENIVELELIVVSLLKLSENLHGMIHYPLFL
jgi:hypothetical protein